MDINKYISQIYSPQATSSWIKESLGINPKKGGSPPNDIKDINNLNFKEGLLTLDEDKWVKWYILFEKKSITNEKEITQ